MYKDKKMKRCFVLKIAFAMSIFISQNVYSAERVLTFEEEMIRLNKAIQVMTSHADTRLAGECFKKDALSVLNSKDFQQKLKQCIQYEETKVIDFDETVHKCLRLRSEFIENSIKKCQMKPKKHLMNK